MLKVKRSKVKVTARGKVSAVKRYTTAIDKLSDFRLGKVSMGVVINWRGVGRPQVGMHSQLPRFLVTVNDMFRHDI